MSYLLDTNVMSELRKAPRRRSTEFNIWAARCRPLDTYLSVITVLELRVGVERKRRADPAQAEVLRRWLDGTVLGDYGRRILDVDRDVVEAAAPMHVPVTHSAHDVLIAATAQAHGLVVATRNESDFEPLGVAVENPWTTADSG